MSKPTALERKFKMGATVLNDINPDWTPEQVLAAYAPNYPFLENATLSEPTLEGGYLVYTVHKPAVQTKGGAGVQPDTDPSIEDALARISTWAQEPSVPSGNHAERWGGVHRLVANRAQATTDAALDPFLIPLA